MTSQRNMQQDSSVLQNTFWHDVMEGKILVAILLLRASSAIVQGIKRQHR